MKHRSFAPEDLEFVSRQSARHVSIGDVVSLGGAQVGVVTQIDQRSRLVKVGELVGITRGGIDTAANAFREFSGMEPAEVVDLQAPKVSGPAWLLGIMTAVEYETVRDGKRERYRHGFKRSARPALAVTIDAHQLVILGGGYRVTDRGITDD